MWIPVSMIQTSVRTVSFYLFAPFFSLSEHPDDLGRNFWIALFIRKHRLIETKVVYGKL